MNVLPRSICRTVLLLCIASGWWLVACAGPTALPSPTPTRTPRPTSSSTPSSTATATWTSTPRPSATATSSSTPTFTPTSTPTFTPTPTPDPRRLLVTFVSDYARNDDIYILDPATGDVVQITQSPAEERDPVFSPDGRWLIFRSNAEGGWAFYRINLQTGEYGLYLGENPTLTAYRGRLDPLPLPGWAGEAVYESYQDGYLNLYVQTVGGRRSPALPAPVYITDTTGQKAPTGNYAPAWRPGGRQVAYTSWQDGHKAIYLADGDGSLLVSPTHLMTNTLDDEYPAWHPGGQKLVFVRWQNYDADLYELDLSTGVQTRLTENLYPDLAPAFAPDGTLFWTRYAPGPAFEIHDPFYPGHWQLWMQIQGGQEQQVPLPVADMDVYTPAAGFALWPNWIRAKLVSPAPTPTLASDQLADLFTLDIQCAGGDPRINALLVDDYLAWRADILTQSGYDILGNISDMFRPLGYGTRSYGQLSWHRTGRTLDILQEWRDPPDEPSRLLVVREDLGAQTYWRLYLRTQAQDGSMGEPVVAAPWIGWFNLDPAQEPKAYAAGGKPDVIPSGYYVDFTRLAGRYGWQRIASYQERDYNWKWDSVGMEFWHYERTDGLTWWQAMRQIYPQDMLEAYYGWEVCTKNLGLDPAWLQAKGIPSATPTSK